MIKSLSWVWLLLLQATPVSAVPFGQMESALGQRGISVQYRNRCDIPGALATYARHSNVICINKRLAPGTAEQSSALAHEAMHAIQDCLAGLNNGRLVPVHEYANMSIGHVTGKLSSSRKNSILASYPRDEWKIELEAYAFEGQPDAVYELLTKVC